jgi:trehalose/maltose transport system substrate-binding protein
MRTVSACLLLASFCLEIAGCARPSPKTVSISLIDQGWFDKAYRDWRTHELNEFTRETGIPVQLLPSPESAAEQLTLWRGLLESRSTTPDVYAIDVIWPGILGDYLLDLKAYIPEPEIAAHFKALIDNDTVNGRLVALPYNLAGGLLYYRKDLLREYGYRSPPATWDELERMSARIQAGERAKGDRDFWGFVWQGGATEALTCNALEWQTSEGGGTIVNDKGSVDVDNPRAIRAWERAAHWVGSISPPGVTAYTEFDAFNVWESGHAAFMRNWPTAYIVTQLRDSASRDKFGLTALPAGSAGHTSTFGGMSYGVSRYSLHPQQAIALVRYLCSRSVELRRCHARSNPPTIADLYNNPELRKANPYFDEMLRVFKNNMVARPSTITCRKYPDVSRAYFQTVHAVLMGSVSAADAAAGLQKQLAQITNLKGQAN